MHTEPSIREYLNALRRIFVIEDLLADLRTFGFVFETRAVRDLRVYVDALGRGTVRHYLDKTGLECDAIVSDEDGNFGLFEIRLGGDELIGRGIKTLQKLASKIDTDRYLTPLAKSGYIAVAGGEKNCYLPGKQYRILRKGKAVVCA